VLCFNCHKKTAAEQNTPFVHTPVQEGECRKCHAHHVSREKGLLVMPVKELCLSCHKKLVSGKGKLSVHKPAAEGACMECHVGHGAGRANLVKVAGIELCTRCHKRKTRNHPTPRHPMGEIRKTVRGTTKVVTNLTCWQCHDPHTSNSRRLVTKQCVDCHEK
jgi:predicted CXXCH cytochrome family protein